MKKTCNKPSITIIIPVYNSEKFLNKCIDSVLTQTYKDFELILVNDGSTDKSLEICNQYRIKYPQYRILVINKKNEGVSVARNKGIEIANGDFITFIDSDDWVEPTYLEDFRHHEIEADMYSQGIRYYIAHKDSYSLMFKYNNQLLNITDNPTIILKNQILENGCPVAKLFKREILFKSKLIFNTKLSINEDHLFVTEYIANIDSIFLSAQVNYNYFFDYRQVSLTKKSRDSDEYLEVALALRDGLIRLNKKYDKNQLFWLPIYHLYGPQQILKAVVNASDRNNNELFSRSLKAWSEYKPTTDYIVNTSFTNKVISKLLNSNIKPQLKKFLVRLLNKSKNTQTIIKFYVKSRFFK